MPDTFGLLEEETKKIKQIFLEKDLFMNSHKLPYNKSTYGFNNPTSYDNSILLESIGIIAFMTPAGYIDRGSCQAYTLNMVIFNAIPNPNSQVGYNKEPIEYVKFKINTYPNGKVGWSKLIEIEGGAENYRPFLIDHWNRGIHYDLDSIIYSTEELLNQWFRDFIKIVFEKNKF